MSNNIFIVTRRQFKDSGIGTQNKTPIQIEQCDNLWKFWLGVLVKRESVRKILDKIRSEKDCKTEEKNAEKWIENDCLKAALEEIINTDLIGPKADIFKAGSFYNIDKEDSPWKVKPEFLRRLFQNLNSNLQNELEIDHLMNLYKVGDDIFVYHHWLDRWLSEQPSDKFLKAIRTDVIANIDKSKDFTLNWLVHDTDLGCSGADGMICCKGKIINENNPNFVENSILYDNEKQKVKEDFANDNFWIFTHTKGMNGYYENYILNNSITSADELYKKIVFSIKKLKHLAQVLKDMGFTEQGTISDEKDPKTGKKDLEDELFTPFIDYCNFGVETKSIPSAQGQELIKLDPSTLSAEDFIDRIKSVLNL